MDKRFQKGQSLVEILVGLGIISVMIGASTYALVSVLRTSMVTEQNQTGGLIGNSMLDSVSTLAEADWNKIYNLSKGSSYHYFMVNSPTTTPLAIGGDESMLADNIINGLVGNWKFDESLGSWAYDFSGKGNHGSLVGSPDRIASADCKAGKCLYFDRNKQIFYGIPQYINAGRDPSLNITSSGSYSLWVKIKSQPLLGENFIFMDKSGSPSPLGIRTGYINSAGVYKLYISYGNSQEKSSNYALNIGKWYHLTFVHNDANDTDGIYVNGNLLSETPNQTGNPGSQTETDFCIGAPCNGYPGDFYLDDARVYNRPLSAAEISQLYNSAVYNRYFYVDNVRRMVCGSGDITTDELSVCFGASGVSEDPATQKITVGTLWSLKGVYQTLENSIYVTRWVNSAVTQSNWDGAKGNSGPVTEFGSDYYDYVGDISTTTSGSIKISGF